MKAKIKEGIRTLHIGKQGVTGNLLREIKDQLGSHRTLCIRILRSARKDRDSKVIAREVSSAVNAELIRVRGNTFILEKQ